MFESQLTEQELPPEIKSNIKTPVFEMICFRGTSAIVTSATFKRECVNYIRLLAEEMGPAEAEFRQRILTNLMEPLVFKRDEDYQSTVGLDDDSDKDT